MTLERQDALPPQPEAPAETAADGRDGSEIFSVSNLIIAVNVIIFLAMAWQAKDMRFDSELLVQWGAKKGPLVREGEYWRMLTSVFLHASLLHIAFNMYCLYAYGWMAEMVMGRLRFLLAYLFTGVMASAVSLAVHPDGVSVGASGAIFGVIGLLIAFFHLKILETPGVPGNPVVPLLKFAAINLVIGAIIPALNNAAHIGGLVAGILVGAVYGTYLKKKIAEAENPFPSQFPD